tara:strand:- start:57543 stop:57728 length:186 start_codon:yes stop_codon:yes gene_type:complete
MTKKTAKELSKQELLDLIPVLTIEEAANHFNISRFTLKRFSRKLGVKSKPAPVGRPPIQLI